jgi:hypothetical protein
MPPTVADRDLGAGAGDLGRSRSAHLAHALLQRVHTLTGMHVRKTAAMLVNGSLSPERY